MALRRMVVRIYGEHRCQAVCRVHSDQAPELSGEKTKRMLESLGVYKTATAGFDPDANGRAERGVRFFKEKIRTYLVNNIRSERFQGEVKDLWPFAAQHAAEVQKRQVYGEEDCDYEFASLALVKVKEPKDVLEPRFR